MNMPILHTWMSPYSVFIFIQISGESILFKDIFLVTRCHNSVMQRLREIDISSKEIPHVTLLIT